MGHVYKKLTQCRVCGSARLKKYIDLGQMPLVNSLLDLEDAAKRELRLPLQVLYCQDCSLSQLSIVVNPKLLFSEYVYRSSISQTFQKHCAAMAKKVITIPGVKAGDLAVDIASNDGCLLDRFKAQDFKVLGIEPAKNLSRLANLNGVPTVNEFWSTASARKILKTHGKAKVITATNVLAHVDDLKEFLKAVDILLDDRGVFVIEVPYAQNLIVGNQFDTIYHEHLSYFLVRPLKRLYEENGFTIGRVEKYEIHGGSIRLYASRGHLKEDTSVARFEALEKKNRLYQLSTYENFDRTVRRFQGVFLNRLKELREKDKKIVAYGASAKGNVLLNYCGVKSDMVDFVVDDTPEKQNKLVPGSRIPVRGAQFLETEKPDYIMLLSWNFSKELMRKTKAHKERGGKYIVPIPKFSII